MPTLPNIPFHSPAGGAWGPGLRRGVGWALLVSGLAGPTATPSLQGATLGYATYFGGGQYDGAYAVAVDAAGNAYVGGSTDSTNGFPVLSAYQAGFAGGQADAFLAKFDPRGRLVFSTLFGGSGYDAINDVKVAPDGTVWVAGETRSVDLPTTEGAFLPDYAGGSAFGSGDGFIARFTEDGSDLVHCTYFGASGDERIGRLALTGDGGVAVTGRTDSRNLPRRGALQPGYGGGESDGFVARFDATLANLVFSTYFGGEDRDEDLQIAIDSTGAIHLGGQTLSTNFPVTAGAFQTKHLQNPEHPSNWDGFIAKLSADGSQLVYSTYVGDATGDAVFGIAADAAGSAYVTGFISASWDPGTFPLGFQPQPGYGFADAWVAKLLPDGSNFEWFSYLGGFGQDYAYGLALDADANLYVTGITLDSSFRTWDAPQSRFGGGGQDAFVAKVSADGKRLVYATFLGGSGEEWGYRVTVDGEGNVIAVGQSASRDFPVFQPQQATNASVRSLPNPADATIVKITPAPQRPALKLARSGLNVVLSWSTNFPGFGLESTVSLAPGVLWNRVDTVPKATGTQWNLTLRASGEGQIFRLRSTNGNP